MSHLYTQKNPILIESHLENKMFIKFLLCLFLALFCTTSYGRLVTLPHVIQSTDVTIQNALPDKSPPLWIQCLGIQGEDENTTIPANANFKWHFDRSKVPFGGCMFGWGQNRQFFLVAGVYSPCDGKENVKGNVDRAFSCRWRVRKDGFFLLNHQQTLQKVYEWSTKNYQQQNVT